MKISLNGVDTRIIFSVHVVTYIIVHSLRLCCMMYVVDSCVGYNVILVVGWIEVNLVVVKVFEIVVF